MTTLMKNGQEFFFYSDNKIKIGEAWHCENCNQLCAVDTAWVTSGEIKVIYSGSVSEMWPLEDGRAVCSRCCDLIMQLRRLEK